MTRPTRMEINCTTGEQTVVELTDEEIAQLEADRKLLQEQKAERESAEAAAAEAKASAQAKLASLGLTAEEIAALTK